MGDIDVNELEDSMRQRVREEALAFELLDALESTVDLAGHTPFHIYIPRGYDSPLQRWRDLQLPLIRHLAELGAGDEHCLTGAGCWLDPRSGGAAAIAADLTVHTRALLHLLPALRSWVVAIGLPIGSQIQHSTGHYDELTVEGWRIGLRERDLVHGRAFNSSVEAERYLAELKG